VTLVVGARERLNANTGNFGTLHKNFETESRKPATLGKHKVMAVTGVERNPGAGNLLSITVDHA